MMLKNFSHERHDVSEEELLEYNAFCQMLPGPSSTQTVMLIAMKRGGIPLALVTLFIWVFPAAFLMGLFSFLLKYIDARSVSTSLFSFIQPMSVGFILYAAWKMMGKSVRHMATISIMLGSLAVTFMLRSPWVFPLVLIVAGLISNLSNQRIPEKFTSPKKIRWINLWLFVVLFIAAGTLSELARTGNWHYKKAFNLFENFYRFGAFVFGGGQALLPMMLYQFVNRPLRRGHSAWLSSADLLTGYGVVQAMPGPVFSICSFTGGMIMSQYGVGWQLAGCTLATIAVFLPSTLLLFFLFPLYQNLKQHVVIYRSLEGINAAVVGFIWASAFILIVTLYRDLGISNTSALVANALVTVITILLLRFTKIPAPVVVILTLLAGWVMHF